jgi:plastocyanin
MRLSLVLSAVLALILAGCGADEGQEEQAGPAGQTIEIVETDFALDPADVQLEGPGTYTFRAVNEGETAHALEIEGMGIEEETEEFGPGESAELTVELTEAGEYELYCPVEGHKELGMEGTLTVAGAAGGGATTGETTTDETTTDETTTEDEGDGYDYG